MKQTRKNTKTKWAILILGALTNTIVVAVQAMSFSVLAPEISTELKFKPGAGGIDMGNRVASYHHFIHRSWYSGRSIRSKTHYPHRLPVCWFSRSSPGPIK